jgi:Flp pilus assembly protein TadG
MGGNHRQLHSAKSSPSKQYLRTRRRGQTMVLIAISAVFLFAIVGLAVDGGASYALRRQAQNASDSAVMAGAQRMLTYLNQILDGADDCDLQPSPASQEDAVRDAINTYITANKAGVGTVTAYFVNKDKQIVTVASGENHGSGTCGSSQGPNNPCEVGSNGEIPWELGVDGVTLISQAQSGSFFAGVMGWNTLQGGARSTAFIFNPTAVSNINVQPLALFRRPDDYQEFQFGQIYTLLDGDVTQGGGNWGWLDWNGNGSSRTMIQNFINCGFNPSDTTQAQWLARCPSAGNNTDGEGPTQHYRSTLPADTYLPEANVTLVHYLKYGAGMSGWWIAGSSGSPNSSCTDFWNKVHAGGQWDGRDEGVYIYFPIFDNTYDTGGATGLRFHLRQIVLFFVKKPTGTLQNPDPSDWISCRPMAPTATPQPTATPTGASPASPDSSGGTHWYIQGRAKSFYSNNASGELGDLCASLSHFVGLDR